MFDIKKHTSNFKEIWVKKPWQIIVALVFGILLGAGFSLKTGIRIDFSGVGTLFLAIFAFSTIIREHQNSKIIERRVIEVIVVEIEAYLKSLSIIIGYLQAPDEDKSTPSSLDQSSFSTVPQ